MLVLMSVNSAEAQTMLSDLEAKDGVSFLIGSSSPYSGSVTDENGMTGQLVDGLRHGEWMFKYENGKPQFLSVYESGILQRRAGWHENGIESSSLSYKDGRPHGAMVHRDDTGIVRERHIYVDGKVDGLEEIFDQNGQRTITTEFKAGVRHGKRIWWYDSDHERWVTNYAEGERDGDWIQFTRDGRVVEQSEWKDGQLVARIDRHQGH